MNERTWFYHVSHYAHIFKEKTIKFTAFPVHLQKISPNIGRDRSGLRILNSPSSKYDVLSNFFIILLVGTNCYAKHCCDGWWHSRRIHSFLNPVWQWTWRNESNFYVKFMRMLWLKEQQTRKQLIWYRPDWPMLMAIWCPNRIIEPGMA